MGEHADVAPIADRDARVERRAHAGTLLTNAHRLSIDALSPPTVLQHRITGGDRRTQGHSLLRHEAKDLRSAGVSMVDRLDASHYGAAHSFRYGRVRHDGTPTASPGLAEHGELVLGECG